MSQLVISKSTCIRDKNEHMLNMVSWLQHHCFSGGQRLQHLYTYISGLALYNRGMGMEVCCTLGMLEKQQALELKKAGLTAYNHNLDTSREYYPNVITTRSYDDRLETLEHVREAGINVCSGNFDMKTKIILVFLLLSASDSIEIVG